MSATGVAIENTKTLPANLERLLEDDLLQAVLSADRINPASFRDYLITIRENYLSASPSKTV